VDRSVLVVHAGRHGSTAEVAEVVAEELRRCGMTVDADGCIVGVGTVAGAAWPMVQALPCPLTAAI
jgi:flavorubredoxin